MISELAKELAAQVWCKPQTKKIIMIPELAEAFAEILDKILSKPSEVRCDYCSHIIKVGERKYCSKCASGIQKEMELLFEKIFKRVLNENKEIKNLLKRHSPKKG